MSDGKNVDRAMWLILGLVAGAIIGFYNHPYEECARKYEGEENISECVWLKMRGFKN